MLVGVIENSFGLMLVGVIENSFGLMLVGVIENAFGLMLVGVIERSVRTGDFDGTCDNNCFTVVAEAQKRNRCEGTWCVIAGK